MIDFKEFNKNELVIAAELLLKQVNGYEHALSSVSTYKMEPELEKKLNVMKFNRLADLHNKKVKEFNALPKQLNQSARRKADKLYVEISKSEKQINMHLAKCLELEVIDKKEYDELSIKHR